MMGNRTDGGERRTRFLVMASAGFGTLLFLLPIHADAVPDTRGHGDLTPAGEAAPVMFDAPAAPAVAAAS